MPVRKVLRGSCVPVRVWTDDLEEEAERQLLQLASLPFVFHHIAVMPDVHAGRGSTIGTVYVSRDTIIPAAVGVDIGCGMAAVQMPFTLGRLEGKIPELRAAIERSIPVGFHQRRDPVPDSVKWNGWENFPLLTPHVRDLFQKARCQHGTLGGGNHFIEVCVDPEENLWVLLHSGSRNIGKTLADVHIDIAEEQMKLHGVQLPHRDFSYLRAGTEECRQYLFDVHWAQAYALKNREIMLALILEDAARLLNGGEKFDPLVRVNCHHNYVAEEVHFGEPVYVTRKGAIRAEKGDDGIVPGSMGTKSFIVRGLGNPDSFNSASHGAGRRMSRTKARSMFTEKDLVSQTRGVECRKDKGVIDEIPQAYKNIETVLENENDLVEPVVALKQVLCVKG
ncbi:MAG TPA: RtcB family protein [Bacteroidota bacterium]|nr:RtcB family protein [Bacteroidota bacterium]